MNLTVDRDRFIVQVKTFKPEKYAETRVLALYSATIALADEQIMTQIIEIGKHYAITRMKFYEIVLQSYLFLGFPRMLTAADNLSKMFPFEKNDYVPEKISENESQQWFDDGFKLYRKVYGDKYSVLEDKVIAIAPEIFRWMIIEGYGKVLSRPHLDISCREMSIVAFLMIENREKQLFSHLKGAINIGVSTELINYIVEDIGPAAGDGYKSSLTILKRLRFS